MDGGAVSARVLPMASRRSASDRGPAMFNARIWANAAAIAKPGSIDERRAARRMFDGLYALLGRG